MLTLQTDIISLISSHVTGLTTIANPSVLAGLRDIGPLLPACIVMPGAGEADEQAIPSLPVSEQQQWDIIIIVAHQNTNAANGLTEQIAGGFMNGVLKALHGHKIANKSQKHGFIYLGRKEPAYNVGYAEFPMTFLAQTLVGK